MAGLLDGFGDFIKTPEGQGLLAATFGGLAGARRGAPLNSLGMAGMAGLQGYSGAQDREKQMAEAAQMQKYRDMQQQTMQMQLEAAKKKAAQDEAFQSGIGQFIKPGQPALAPLMGDTSSGILPSAGRAAVAPSIDQQGLGMFMAQNGKLEDGLKLLQPKDKKFSTAPQYDQSGRAFILAEDGTMRYLDGVKARDKLVETDLGGTKGFRTEYSPTLVGQLTKSQSPDSKATNQVAWANFGLSKDRLSFDKNGGVDGGVSQSGFNKQFGKPQPGYRWKSDGSLEFIPGGPADQKAQAQKGGEGTVGGVVADLRDKYTQLDQENGIVSTNNRFGTNMGAAFGASSLGQTLNGIVGTKTQSARDSIAMTRPLLLQAIMKATGMSAKQMDSNAELKMYLATATDPQKGLEANLEALDRIESLYGGGSEKFKAQMPRASTVNGWSMEKVR